MAILLRLSLGAPRALAAVRNSFPSLRQSVFRNVAGFRQQSLNAFDKPRFLSFRQSLLETEEEPEEVLSSDDALDNLRTQGASPQLISRLQLNGINKLFPIQKAAFGPVFKGQDFIGRARTGTGKTLAFIMPVVEQLNARNGWDRRLPAVLVLEPTRELAKQVAAEFQKFYPQLRVASVYGGTPFQPQEMAIRRGLDVVVATPGRCMDLLEKNVLDFSAINVAILDEADEMLNKGFQEEVERILQTVPQQRQTLLFSATVPSWVRALANQYTRNAVSADLIGESETRIPSQVKMCAMPLDRELGTRATAARGIIDVTKAARTIIFTKTKADASALSVHSGLKDISVCLHGDVSQGIRESRLEMFRRGTSKVLIATDVASRGLDIPSVDLVIHFCVPEANEAFIHRTGRTGRAGKTGTAVLFHTPSQTSLVRTMEREIGIKFETFKQPTADELLDVAAKNIEQTLDTIHPRAVHLFQSVAERLLQENGPSSLAAALAYIAGYHEKTSFKTKALLSQMDGVSLTITPTAETTFSSMQDAKAALSNLFGAQYRHVMAFAIAEDKQTLYVDVSETFANMCFRDNIQTSKDGFELKLVNKVPANLQVQVESRVLERVDRVDHRGMSQSSRSSSSRPGVYPGRMGSFGNGGGGNRYNGGGDRYNGGGDRYNGGDRNDRREERTSSFRY
eukprot:GILK01002045.1.p1 GENE.GILK01002045.1~~GILK01002045.1.p1  ORF type:complete len:698 (+),score=104.21 GILK01002045.1:50-2095(+)